MAKIYTYNPRTHKLHVLGYCANSNGADYESFTSEEAAISAHAGQVISCIPCKRKIDKLIQKDKNTHK